MALRRGNFAKLFKGDLSKARVKASHKVEKAMSPKDIHGLKRTMTRDEWKQAHRSMRKDHGQRLSKRDKTPNVKARLKDYKAQKTKGDVYKSTFTGKPLKPRPKPPSPKDRAQPKVETTTTRGRRVRPKPTKENKIVSPRRKAGEKKKVVTKEPKSPRQRLKQSSDKVREYKLSRKPDVPESTNMAAGFKPPNWAKKHWNKQMASRIGISAGIGAGLGLAKASTDKENDGALSTAEKMIKGAAGIVGADYGAEFGVKHLGTTVGKMTKGDIVKGLKKTMTESEELRWQKNMQRKLGIAGRIGIAAMGAATLLDIAEGYKTDREATAERNRQEQELAQKMSEEKRRQKKESYGYVDYGQVVLQQWEKRIGHYAMGNAKFQ